MIIKKPDEIPYEDMSAFKGVKKQILVGARDGSNEIVMRLFSVEPGGNTPYHSHGFPHVIKVEQGRGIVIDKDGNEHTLEKNQVIYVNDDEVHGFKNQGTGPFDFICIVPPRGEQ
jgi:quercetin dioxygenase-like cupin family protein